MVEETSNNPIFGQVGSMSITWIGIGGIFTLIILYFIVTYNSIISTKNAVGNAFSAIDTVLQNRYDLIPNLVEVVKQYASHETKIFEQVTEIRASLMNQSGADGKGFADDNMLQGAMKSLFAVAESYPDLKASSNFLELQTQWSEMEDRLQGARRAYNASVKLLNDKKEMFPSNIIASMMKLPQYAMFEADTGAKTTKMDAKTLFNS